MRCPLQPAQQKRKTKEEERRKRKSYTNPVEKAPLSAQVRLLLSFLLELQPGVSSMGRCPHLQFVEAAFRSTLDSSAGACPSDPLSLTVCGASSSCPACPTVSMAGQSRPAWAWGRFAIHSVRTSLSLCTGQGAVHLVDNYMESRGNADEKYGYKN